MPILNVKVSARRTPELSARINETLLDLTAACSASGAT